MIEDAYTGCPGSAVGCPDRRATRTPVEAAVAALTPPSSRPTRHNRPNGRKGFSVSNQASRTSPQLSAAIWDEHIQRVQSLVTTTVSHSRRIRRSAPRLGAHRCDKDTEVPGGVDTRGVHPPQPPLVQPRRSRFEEDRSSCPPSNRSSTWPTRPPSRCTGSAKHTQPAHTPPTPADAKTWPSTPATADHQAKPGSDGPRKPRHTASSSDHHEV